MSEGLAGYLGAAVLFGAIIFGLATVNSDPPQQPAGTTQSSYGPIAELGSHLLGGLTNAVKSPDVYAAQHPGR